MFHDIVGNLNFIFIQKRQQSGQVQGDQMRILEELRSLKEIMKDAKLCPRCKMAISKTEGCNKMHCENCGEYFCYQCNRAITGYEHFKWVIFLVITTSCSTLWIDNKKQSYFCVQRFLRAFSSGGTGQMGNADEPKGTAPSCCTGTCWNACTAWSSSSLSYMPSTISKGN